MAVTRLKMRKKIFAEVAKYSDELASRPCWLVLNKIDLLIDEDIEEHCNNIISALDWQGPVYKIAALKKANTQPLIYAIMEHIENVSS